MKKIKSAIWPILIAILLAGAITGCVRIDYAVFKAKYPNTGVFEYIWNKL